MRTGLARPREVRVVAVFRLRELPGARADRVLAATCPATLLVISAGTGGLLHRNLDGPHRYLMRHCTSPMALIPSEHRSGSDEREHVAAG